MAIIFIATFTPQLCLVRRFSGWSCPDQAAVSVIRSLKLPVLKLGRVIRFESGLCCRERRGGELNTKHAQRPIAHQVNWPLGDKNGY